MTAAKEQPNQRQSQPDEVSSWLSLDAVCRFRSTLCVTLNSMQPLFRKVSPLSNAEPRLAGGSRARSDTASVPWLFWLSCHCRYRFFFRSDSGWRRGGGL